MKRQAGLWIDHREAVLVFPVSSGEEMKRIESGMEKDVRFSGGNRPENGVAEDRRDAQFKTHLNVYYDEVISHLRNAESILLFGPGEAKGEFEKRLAMKVGPVGRVVVVEAADKMTEPQIAKKVREYFRE
jgi:hypothetical protein